jgi:hypothetical protein
MANTFRIPDPFDTRPRTLLECDECSGDGLGDPDQKYMDFCDRMEEDMARLYESIIGDESEEEVDIIEPPRLVARYYSPCLSSYPRQQVTPPNT